MVVVLDPYAEGHVDISEHVRSHFARDSGKQKEAKSTVASVLRGGGKLKYIIFTLLKTSFLPYSDRAVSLVLSRFERALFWSTKDKAYNRTPALPFQIVQI